MVLTLVRADSSGVTNTYQLIEPDAQLHSTSNLGTAVSSTCLAAARPAAHACTARYGPGAGGVQRLRLRRCHHRCCYACWQRCA